jgi:TPR repeat protein
MCQGGPGLEKDYAESMKWFQLAAAQGHIEALYSVAWAYYSGEGVTISYPLAKEWFEKAAGVSGFGYVCNLCTYTYT